ncbi:MAG: hypothetical protein PHD02_03230 [Bacilli bacterium]|nr:hypothetical protein [Bacilli bacterium]
MKKIYIVLTYPGAVLSRIIRLYEKAAYSHVSISLDDHLDQMYSFSRLHPYNAFIGGFVQESPEFGSFKRFKKTTTMILEIEVSEEQYNKIEETIKEFNTNHYSYKFNILGLIMAGFKIKRKCKNEFYCAEFVKYVLEEAGCSYEIPDVPTPKDFLNLTGSKLIYEGYLKNYKKQCF